MKEWNKYLKDPKFVKWLKRPDEELEAYWQMWMNENTDKAEELLQAKAFFKSVKFKEYTFSNKDKDKDWKRINSALRQNKYSFSLKIGAFVKVAAVILLAIISGIVVFYTTYDFPSDPPVALITKKAELGQKLTIQLSDGTRIKLNSGSELTYPSEFSDSLRKVILKGEGYFEVSHDIQKPFIVVSNNVITKVLGTSFSINSFEEEDVKVALVSGTVEVNINGMVNERVTLMPGQKAIWNRTHFDIDQLDPKNDLGWNENILVFSNSDILDIVNKLERWYGVNVEVFQHDQIANSFYGEFENESLENVLESIGHALEFRFQINNNNVTIKPNKAMHEP